MLGFSGITGARQHLGRFLAVLELGSWTTRENSVKGRSWLAGFSNTPGALFVAKGGYLSTSGQSHEPWYHRSGGSSTTFTLLLLSSSAKPSAEHERTDYSETRKQKVMCFKKSVHGILSFFSRDVWTDA